MSNKDTASSSGIGVLGALGVAFVVLKITGYIDWSWWLVTAPFWGLFALILACVVFALSLTIMMGAGRELMRYLRLRRMRKLQAEEQAIMEVGKKHGLIK